MTPFVAFQMMFTIIQASKFLEVRDLGRKNIGSRSLPVEMGEAPRHELVLSDANDWRPYGEVVTPHFPNKRRAAGFWATVEPLAEDIPKPQIPSL